MEQETQHDTSHAEQLERYKAMLKEVEALRAKLTPQIIREVVGLARQIPNLKVRSDALAAGDLRLLSRIKDEAGLRLREAIGRAILGETVEPGDPLGLVVLLWADPSPADVQELKQLGLTPAFAEGRWRPAATYSGVARPEDLADIVLQYGGDCRQDAKPRVKRPRNKRGKT